MALSVGFERSPPALQATYTAKQSLIRGFLLWLPVLAIVCSSVTANKVQQGDPSTFKLSWHAP